MASLFSVVFLCSEQTLHFEITFRTCCLLPCNFLALENKSQILRHDLWAHNLIMDYLQSLFILRFYHQYDHNIIKFINNQVFKILLIQNMFGSSDMFERNNKMPKLFLTNLYVSPRGFSEVISDENGDICINCKKINWNSESPIINGILIFESDT